MQTCHADPTTRASTAAGQAAPAAAPDLDALLERHLPQLRAFVRLQMAKAMRERESSSDIVQSVCRELVQQHGRGFEWRGEAAFRRWLCVAASNKIRKRANWHRVHPGATPQDEARYSDFCASTFTPSRAFASREAMATIESAFDDLPEHYREVIAMARIAGMSHAEVAAATGRTEIAARQLLHRALAALSMQLSRHGLMAG